MMSSSRNNGGDTGERDKRGRFAEGNSGRPKGARHKVTLAVQELLDGEAEAVTRKVIEHALDGDAVAQRLVLERVLPPKKDTPVRLELPAIETVTDLVGASAALLEAVADGDITPAEAQAVAGLLQQHARAVELHDLDERVKKLEAEGSAPARRRGR